VPGRDIACVLVNTAAGRCYPNSGLPPGDSSLVDSGRGAHFDRVAYTKWLQELRHGVAVSEASSLIFDEVFVGFPARPPEAHRNTSVFALTW